MERIIEVFPEGKIWRDDILIFVSVGSRIEGFDRLLKIMDELISESQIEDEVFAQIGTSDYQPKNYRFARFIPLEDYERHIKMSRLVITSGGASAIASALRAHKPSVSFPRLPEFKEVFNDKEHALQLSRKLAGEGKILLALNKEELKQAINEAKGFQPNFKSDNSQIIQMIEEFLK
jgi:UDP-N-acetylglucosamine transferase subunit ALG13